jgi:hypothetical protein
MVKNLRDVTNIAALKDAFMILGELDRHVKGARRTHELNILLRKCGRGYGPRRYGGERFSVRNILHHKLLNKRNSDSISLMDVIMLCRHAYKIGKALRLSESLVDTPLFRVTKVSDEKESEVRRLPGMGMAAQSS